MAISCIRGIIIKVETTYSSMISRKNSEQLSHKRHSIIAGDVLLYSRTEKLQEELLEKGKEVAMPEIDELNQKLLEVCMHVKQDEAERLVEGITDVRRIEGLIQSLKRQE